MAKKQFIMDLAKLVIAAAWADGILKVSEVNALKDLMFSISDLNSDDWIQLEVYLVSPVSEAERERLLSSVLGHIRSGKDKREVFQVLTGLVESDGRVTDAEAALLENVKQAVDGQSTGFFPRLSSMTGRAIQRRSEKAGQAPNREDRIDDYLKNTIYFQLVTDMEREGVIIDLPEEEIRKLCLAAGLMAKVAWVDSEICEKEKDAIQNILAGEWGLTEAQARVVRDISLSRVVRGLDYPRLTRSFFECTTAGERTAFLKSLFRIANASNMTSHDEIEKIRRIAGSLKISHQDFIEAKLSIPSEDRNGL